jgi:hypothetical protein
MHRVYFLFVLMTNSLLTAAGDQEVAELLYSFAAGITNCTVPDWSGGNVCAWQGIVCENNFPIQLNLKGFGCSGSVQLAALPSTLYSIDLSFNSFNGTVNLDDLPPNLLNLDLFSNDFEGIIDLGNLPTNLAHLDLGRNSFEGTVDLTHLPHGLTELDLFSNNFNGTLNLSSLPPLLGYMSMSGNSFSGTVDLTNYPNFLFFLDLSRNRFTHLIVNDSHIRSFQFLFLQNNPWVCPLPSLPSWITRPECGELTCNAPNNEAPFLENDYLCYGGINYKCQASSFVEVGTCESPQLINCSTWNVFCVMKYSLNMSRPLVYCGENTTFASATTLCYYNTGNCCKNSSQGGTNDENWLLQGAEDPHGFKCPSS